MNKCICGHEKEDHFGWANFKKCATGCDCHAFRPAPKSEDRPEKKEILYSECCHFLVGVVLMQDGVSFDHFECMKCEKNVSILKQFSAPEKENKKEWEEEFEEARKSQWNGGSPYWPNWDGVKAFISQKKSEWESSAYAKAVDKDSLIWEKARAALLKEIEEAVKKNGNTYDGEERLVYDTTIQEVLTILKEKSQQ